MEVAFIYVNGGIYIYKYLYMYKCKLLFHSTPDIESRICNFN